VRAADRQPKDDERRHPLIGPENRLFVEKRVS
jgi:hypothetical protein